jgi:hypothetical protein
MKFKGKTKSFALVPAAGVVALVLAVSTGAVSASSAQNGNLHVTKECSEFTGLAGSFCTITSSNLAAIKVGSRVYYDQAPGIPAGMLDSNVILSVGTGDWATGRCTLDGNTGLGICQFTDGVGELTGFHARVNVSATGGPNFAWEGRYGFRPEHGQDE